MFLATRCKCLWHKELSKNSPAIPSGVGGLVQSRLPAYSRGMKLKELDRYFQELLDLGTEMPADNSLNGLQVGNLEAPVKKVAFAVDACIETFRRSQEAGANCLFVHHGLFWGHPEALTGGMYHRIRHLMRDSLALYAVHLPLDLHAELGNNASLARHLRLEEIRPFGEYGGIKIGIKGTFPKAMSLDGILHRLGISREECLAVLPFGKEEIHSVGIISGGAASSSIVQQVLDEELDLYLTGEVSHQIYHYCLEGGIHFIAGGHYYTETYGVRAVAHRLAEDTGLETEFLDVPTAL